MLFNNWNISGCVKLRMLDNKTSSFDVVGDIPEGWDWQLFYSCNGNLNIVDVEKTENGLSVLFTKEMLPIEGTYYFQLKGTKGELVKHTNIVKTYVNKSLSGDTQWPVVPSEFEQFEQAVKKYAAESKQSAMESAESARQSAESSLNAQKYAEDAAESANKAQKSREAIENMEVDAVSLSPDSDATVEKSLVDGKVKLTFGIPKGESDIFWLNTASLSRIAETFDEIVAAYKAGKSIWVRDTYSLVPNVAIAPAFLVHPTYDDNDNSIVGMLIVCGGTARGSSGIDEADTLINATYYIMYDPGDPSSEVYFSLKTSMCAELGDSNTPNESRLNGSAGDSTSASPVDHIHPAPFPDWTNNINKALFVGNSNKTPSQAFEWRDVPNGDFTSKVGDFLRVAEVDTQGKPTKWKTETLDNAEGVLF